MHGSKQFGVVLGVLVVAIVLGTALPLVTSADTTTGSENTMIDESAPDRTTDSNVIGNDTTDILSVRSIRESLLQERVAGGRLLTAGVPNVSDRQYTNASGEGTDADEGAGGGDTTTADNTDIADGGSGKAKAEDTSGEDTASGGNGKAKADDDTGSERDDEEGRLVVATLSADDDATDTATLNDEFVTYRNVGDAGLNLTGWTVTDVDGNTYAFPDRFVLAPGTEVTLYTGSGTDTDADLYWGQASEVWNDGADTMTVRNANGTTVLQRSYSRA